MIRAIVFAVCLFANIVVLLAAALTAPLPADTYWPESRWRSSTPEAQGIDSAVLADAFDHIRATGTRIHSLTIIRNGYLVLDARFFPYESNQLHDVASVTKSITTTLIGVAIGDGKLRGVDQPVLSVFGNRRIENRDERKERLTLEHLLAMRSALDCRFEGGEATLRDMRRSGDWIQFMLDLPMIGAAGTVPEYCSGGMHLLSGVLSEATGMSAFEYARRRLFEPLGIHRAEWPGSQGVTHGWGDLHLEPADMARIGYLWLHGGRWKNRQIVPEAWMRAATESHGRVLNREYGYGLWVQRNREPVLFEANGRGGQRIIVLPLKNMVLAITGGAFEPGELGEYMLKAIRSDAPLPANAGATRRLYTAVAAAVRPPVQQRPAPLPAIALRISGKRYLLEDNPFGWRAVTFRFGGGATAEARLEFTDGRVEQRPLGLDGVPRRSPNGRFGLPVALRGSWSEDATFTFDYDEVANINALVCVFSFDRDMASVHVKERSGEADLTIRATVAGR